MTRVLIGGLLFCMGCNPSAHKRGTDEPVDATTARRRAAIHTPDPPGAELATVGGRGVYKTTIRFCIAPNGSTTNVEIIRKSGNDKIDGICHWTVRQWRFAKSAPTDPEQEPCSTQTFVLNLQPAL